MNEATSIEQSRNLNKPGRSFDDKLVTDEQIKSEMTFSMINCSPCKLREDKV